ncbi:MAG TPA: hypothetical protein VLF94_02280 [Chlamydiales bacterium]|nr:hypothetical protein [Chlamydiales bacterium]
MRTIVALFPIFFLTLLTSCYKNHLYVQQEWVDRNFLASSHVGTPDRRQEHPPEGQRLLISWKFPSNLIHEQLTMATTVRFWDNTEEVFYLPIKRSWGYEAYLFTQCKILTYRIQVINACNEVVDTWEHHFWTELIDIDRSSDDVCSQSKQGSVIETP